MEGGRRKWQADFRVGGQSFFKIGWCLAADDLSRWVSRWKEGRT